MSTASVVVLAVLAALLGLAVGSFLNVVVWRVPRGESVVTPRSHCPRCDAGIRPRDEIPVVSWLLLRGRCRDCRAPISARYPLVELLTAAVFVAVAVRFRHDLGLLPAYLYLGALGVALALIDFDVKRLPNVLTLPAYVVGPLLLVLAVLSRDGGGWSALLRALGGLAAMFAFYFVLWYGTRGRGMGFGDVKLAGVVGLFLAFLGWQVWLVGLFAGFFVGGVVGIALMAGGRAGRKTKVPYGPFMLLGALIAVLVGTGIAHSYLTVVGAA